MIEVGYLAKARSIDGSKWSIFFWIRQRNDDQFLLLTWYGFARKPWRLIEMMILLVNQNLVANSSIPWLNMIHLDPLIIMEQSIWPKKPL